MNLFSSIPARIYRRIHFFRSYLAFKRSPGSERLPLSYKDRLPRLDDSRPTTPFDPHYLYHPAWAARILSKTRPEKHVDISSILSFSTIASAFVPIDFYDYRPAKIALSGFTSKQADLMRLPFADDSVRSISCMHTVEHVGLGRYGDPLDPNGDLKAIAELIRVARPGGNILFVVPIGAPTVRFNAHRIYSYRQIVSYFGGCELREFSLIPDSAGNDGMIYNASEAEADRQKYGCGCFWFVKR